MEIPLKNKPTGTGFFGLRTGKKLLRSRKTPSNLPASRGELVIRGMPRPDYTEPSTKQQNIRLFVVSGAMSS